MRIGRLIGEYTSMALRVLIVDDNGSFIAAARVLLEQEGVSVVGSASNMAEGIRLVRELKPDVVLVDVMLGEESGFELARRLAEQHGEDRLAMILISTHSESDFAELIAASPALGYLPKSEFSVDAIRRTLDSSRS
jgi:DNA-binding NarL/FixJ family response regulator